MKEQCAQKFSRMHSVVFEKSEKRERKGSEDAEPADGSRSESVFETEVDTESGADSQCGEEKLSKRQTEKYGFLIITDFFVDFDFHGDSFQMMSIRQPVWWADMPDGIETRCFSVYIGFKAGGKDKI